MSDYYLWLENTATKIKLGLFNEIYSDRLIEEIEDMGASSKLSLASYLEKLIEHLLTLKYIIYLVAKVAFCNGFWLLSR
jgi:hypothetical protein